MNTNYQIVIQFYEFLHHFFFSTMLEIHGCQLLTCGFDSHTGTFPDDFCLLGYLLCGSRFVLSIFNCNILGWKTIHIQDIFFFLEIWFLTLFFVIARILKDNVVGATLIISLLIWIPCSCLIHHLVSTNLFLFCQSVSVMSQIGILIPDWSNQKSLALCGLVQVYHLPPLQQYRGWAASAMRKIKR